MKSLVNLGLRAKILLSVALGCAICAVVALAVGIHFNQKEFRNGLVEKAQTILGRLDIVTQYVANQGGLKPTIERYTNKYKDSSELTKEDVMVILQQVPIYAAMKVGSTESEKEHYKFRVFSVEPRRKENMATPEEMKIFEKFKNNTGLNEIVSKDGENVIVYRPVRLRQSQGCLECHGDPATSPWKNGKDILGFPMENWTDGKLHGVFTVSSNVAEVTKVAAASGETSSTTMLAIFVFLGAIGAIALGALIVSAPIRSLVRVSQALSKASSQVQSASQHIATSSDNLSQSASAQAASLEETVATTEELSSTVTVSAKNAKEASHLSSSSQQAAENGFKEIESLITAMSEISADSKKIEEIINVIDDIAFQTNLLALNAAVEAARAGEQGKGFAVVAEAVRTLAQRSSSAAKDIGALISESVEKVSHGSNIADKSRKELQNIVSSAQNAAQLVNQISHSSDEQARGLTEIAKAMNQLDNVTQRNAATSAESASAATELSAQADSLNSAVNELAKTIHGGSQTKHSAFTEVKKLVKKDDFSQAA